MMDHLSNLIGRYRTRGVLVDTNLLLLWFIGGFDRAFISRFKRTVQFTADDYDLLVRFVSLFRKHVTTPNILSEVNSLSGQIGEPLRTRYFHEFAGGIQMLDEHFVESRAAAAETVFPVCGLTDSAILSAARGKYLILTDDLRLAVLLERSGTDAINFNAIRMIGWK